MFLLKRKQRGIKCYCSTCKYNKNKGCTQTEIIIDKKGECLDKEEK